MGFRPSIHVRSIYWLCKWYDSNIWLLKKRLCLVIFTVKIKDMDIENCDSQNCLHNLIWTPCTRGFVFPLFFLWFVQLVSGYMEGLRTPPSLINVPLGWVTHVHAQTLTLLALSSSEAEANVVTEYRYCLTPVFWVYKVPEKQKGIRLYVLEKSAHLLLLFYLWGCGLHFFS